VPAILQVPVSVLTIIGDLLHPAEQPAIRTVCSHWHQSLDIRHTLTLFWPARQRENSRVSTIRHFLPKAVIRMRICSFSAGFLQQVDCDIITVHQRISLHTSSTPQHTLYQLQKLQAVISEADPSKRVELNISPCIYQCDHPTVVMDALRNIASAITVLMMRSNLTKLVRDMLPLYRLTELSFSMPEDNAQGIQAVTAVQCLHQLRTVWVAFPFNANQMPALLSSLATLSGLAALSLDYTAIRVCLNLSSLQRMTMLSICKDVELTHLPRTLCHLCVEGSVNLHMQQLYQLCNLTIVTLKFDDEEEGLEVDFQFWLPTSLQHLLADHIGPFELGLQESLSRLSQPRTLRICMVLTPETVHRLSSPHFHTFRHLALTCLCTT